MNELRTDVISFVCVLGLINHGEIELRYFNNLYMFVYVWHKSNDANDDNASSQLGAHIK